MDESTRMREKRKGDNNLRSSCFEDTNFLVCVTPRLGIERFDEVNLIHVLFIDTTFPSLPTSALSRASKRFRIHITFLLSLRANPSHTPQLLLLSSSHPSLRDSRTLRRASYSFPQHRLRCDTSFIPLHIPNWTPTSTQRHRRIGYRHTPRAIDPRQRSQGRF